MHAFKFSKSNNDHLVWLINLVVTYGFNVHELVHLLITCMYVLRTVTRARARERARAFQTTIFAISRKCVFS